MPKHLMLLLPALAVVPQAAQAQDAQPGTLYGIRIEANVGSDRFQAQSTHRNRFGYGASIGWDGQLTRQITIGPEASYWRTRHGNEICSTDANAATLCSRSGREIGLGFRLGFRLTPQIMVFGKGGYAENRQSGSFVSANGLYYINGQIVGPGYALSDRSKMDGYFFGGGVEYALIRNFYVNAQYVRSRYDNHTSRHRGMLGVGLRI